MPEQANASPNSSGPNARAGSFEAAFETLRTATEIKFTISEPKGLHMRPCGSIVQAVQGLDCVAMISTENRPGSAQGDSMLELMLLCAEHGSEVTVRVTGPDSAKAIEQLLGCEHWYPSEHKEAWGVS